MKSSRFAAKLITRLFFLLLVLAVVPLLQADSHKLQGLYLVTTHKWIFIFPVILVGGFVTLFVGCTIQKYTKPDWNWLLVVATIVMIAYCATIYMQVLRRVS